jgi:hypothetical protein
MVNFRVSFLNKFLLVSVPPPVTDPLCVGPHSVSFSWSQTFLSMKKRQVPHSVSWREGRGDYLNRISVTV